MADEEVNRLGRDLVNAVEDVEPDAQLNGENHLNQMNDDGGQQGPAMELDGEVPIGGEEQQNGMDELAAVDVAARNEVDELRRVGAEQRLGEWRLHRAGRRGIGRVGRHILIVPPHREGQRNPRGYLLRVPELDPEENIAAEAHNGGNEWNQMNADGGQQDAAAAPVPGPVPNANQRERDHRARIERMNRRILDLVHGRDGINQRGNILLPPRRPFDITEEMIEEAHTLRKKDESDPSPTRYSRDCSICLTENPRQRAVFTRCGHIVCFSCAVDNARSEATKGRCVFCRQESDFVKLFEN